MPKNVLTYAHKRADLIGDSRWILLTWIGVAVGVVLRLAGIGSQSIWFDEGYTAWMVSHPFAEIVRLVKADTSPPLFYLLLHAWTLVFGQSETALRSFSALFSILALVLMVFLAKRILKNPPAIALAVWIGSLSFLLVGFAQEARCYSLMAFFCLAVLYCLLRHLESGGWRWLLLLSASLIAALYIHNMAASYVLTIGLVWLALPSSQSFGRRLRDGSIAAGLIAALYLPWAAVVLHSQVKMVQSGFWVEPPTSQNIKWVLAGLAGVRHYWTWDESMRPLPFWFIDLSEAFAVTIVCAAAIIAYLFQPGRQQRSAMALAFYGLLPPFAVAIFSCWGTPIFMDKVFITSCSVLPILLLIPATSTEKITRRTGFTLGWIGVILAGWSLWGFKTEIHKENWRDAAKLVSELPPARRLIVCVANDGQLPLDYYYHLRPSEQITGAPAGFFDRDPPRTMLRVLKPGDLDQLQKTLRDGNYDDVVLVLSHAGWSDPEHRTEALLKQMYPQREISQFLDVKIVRYTKKAIFHFVPMGK